MPLTFHFLINSSPSNLFILNRNYTLSLLHTQHILQIHNKHFLIYQTHTLPTLYFHLYMCVHLPLEIVTLNTITHYYNYHYTLSHRFQFAFISFESTLSTYSLFSFSQTILFHLLIHYSLPDADIPSSMQHIYTEWLILTLFRLKVQDANVTSRWDRQISM